MNNKLLVYLYFLCCVLLVTVSPSFDSTHRHLKNKTLYGILLMKLYFVNGTIIG